MMLQFLNVIQFISNFDHRIHHRSQMLKFGYIFGGSMMLSIDVKTHNFGSPTGHPIVKADFMAAGR